MTTLATSIDQYLFKIDWRRVAILCASFALAGHFTALPILTADETVPQPDPDDLRALIEKVRESEQLFKDIEYTVHRTYRLLDSETISVPRLLVGQREDLRVVISTDRFKVIRDSHFTDASQTTRALTNVWAYDGVRSRLSSNGQIANEVDGPFQGNRIPRLHTTGMFPESSFPPVPLSTILGGDDAIRASVADMSEGSDWLDPRRTIVVEYSGVETVDDLACDKVTITIARTGVEKPSLVLEIWLGIDRSYFPVTERHAVGRLNASVPQNLAKVESWSKMENGLYVPKRIRTVGYHPDDVMQNVEHKRIRHEWIDEISVVTLSPDYPVEFFQEVPIEQRAAVYQVNAAGVITESHKVGAIVGEAAPQQKGESRFHLLLWINIALIVVLIGIYTVKRRLAL